MEKIFEKANDQHVRAGIVYFKAADSLLYYDSDFTDTKKVSKSDLIDLFNKGILVVNDGTNVVRPTVLAISTNYASVTHTTVGASDKAVATTFYSDGYTG